MFRVGQCLPALNNETHLLGVDIMLRNALKIASIGVLVVVAAQDANAFGHRGGCGWGRNGCGYGGCGYGGWYAGYGNGTWTYGGFGGYPGWGAPANGYVGAQGKGCTLPAPRPNTNSTSSAQAASDSVVLTVNVPADAKVFVNGRATTSTGEVRRFGSAGLERDATYRYQVRAEFVRDGKPVSEEKTVTMTAGQSGSLAFNAVAGTQVADIGASAQR
jgi:uncharacterized protein (TIGR03000 family)